MSGGRARAVVVLLVAATAAVAGAFVPVPPSAAVTGARVMSAVLGVTTVTARGLVPADVPVNVHIVDGVPGARYQAHLNDVRGGRLSLSLTLRRTLGDDTDGEWTGTFRIPAVAAYRFVLDGVSTTQSGDTWDWLPVPAPQPQVLVVGTHVPRLVVDQAPDPVRVDAPVTIRGRLVDTQTGLGMAGVSVRHVVGCDLGLCPDTSVRTDARGWFTVPFRLVRVHGVLVPPQRMRHSFWVLSPWHPVLDRVVVAEEFLAVRVRVSLTAAASRPMVRSGSPVTVVGRVVGSPFGTIRGVDFPTPRCVLVLERLAGASAWRGVGRAVMRSSHRYTVIDPSVARGRHTYRVRAITCGPQQRAVSPRFVVTGA